MKKLLMILITGCLIFPSLTDVNAETKTDNKVVTVEEYNNCVDNFNTARDIIVKQNEQLKKNQEVIKKVKEEKQAQNFEDVKTFSKGAGTGFCVASLVYGLCILLMLL